MASETVVEAQDMTFKLAGAELDWPIGMAPGLTSHPDINMVAGYLDHYASLGLGFVLPSSWTLGGAHGGNGYVKTESGWKYVGGDEHVDRGLRAGYNSKGLAGPGTDSGMASLGDLVDMVRGHGTEMALSLSPHSGKPLEELRDLVEVGRQALKKGVLYVEFNLSCPNIPDRPPFFQDTASVYRFYEYLDQGATALNRFGHPGFYAKYGPLNFVLPNQPRPKSLGGRITSNTLGNQEPYLADGQPAIKVNNGKAGMSGPALRVLGRAQLEMWREAEPEVEHVSVLGVDSGYEVKKRLDLGASAVQLAAILNWPELRECESPGEVVELVKEEFIEATIGSL